MLGILLIQVGTPDAPTTPALRRYLRQFLGDPRVIDLPRWKWWLILNLFILPFRPAAIRRQVSPHLGPANRLAAAPLHAPPGRRAATAAAAGDGRVRHAGRQAVRGVGGAWHDRQGRRTADRAADVSAILGHDHRLGDGRAVPGADEREARAGPARRAAVLRPPRLPRRDDHGHPRGDGAAAVAAGSLICSVFTESRSAIASRAIPTPCTSSGRRPSW